MLRESVKRECLKIVFTESVETKRCKGVLRENVRLVLESVYIDKNTV